MLRSARVLLPLALSAVLPAGALAQFGTSPPQPPAARPPAPVTTALDDIRFLSADALAGRMTGSAGADTAAAYLARRFQEVGLQPAAGGWFQTFTVAKQAPAAQHAHVGGLMGKNVIGLLPGRDPILPQRDRHRRRALRSSRPRRLRQPRSRQHRQGPQRGGRQRLGIGDADPDRRSAWPQSPPARTVVFIAFSGEELGLLGSAYYVKQPIYPLRQHDRDDQSRHGGPAPGPTASSSTARRPRRSFPPCSTRSTGTSGSI